MLANVCDAGPALNQRLSTETSDMSQCCFNAGPASATLDQQ